MADLDQISTQIGQLISLTSTTQNQVRTLFEKHDKMNEELIEQRGAIKILGQQFGDHKSDDARIHDVVTDIKDDFEATKNKGKGLAVGLALVGGGGGIAGFVAAAKAFFGGAG